MQIRTRRWILPAAALTAAAFSIAAWHAGQRTYDSPGVNLTLHSDSELGALLGFFWVVLSILMLLVAVVLGFGGRRREAGRIAGVALGGLAIYAGW